MKKITILIFIVLIVCIVVVGGIYYFSSMKKDITTNNVINNNQKNMSNSAKDVFISWKNEIYSATNYDDVYNIILPKYYPAKVVTSLIQNKDNLSKMTLETKKEYLDLLRRFPSVDQIVITKEEVVGSTAVLHLTSDVKDYTFGGEAHLVNEGGQWKIDYEKWNNAPY